MDPETFEPFTSGLTYPMYVLTVPAVAEARPAGCLVGFATQASIDPPRMLVCLSVANHTYPVAREASLLAVHVLDRERRPEFLREARLGRPHVVKAL